MTPTGDLCVAGTSNSISVPLSVSGDGTVRGAVTLSQSQYGIKQFKALMGALKVGRPGQGLARGQAPDRLSAPGCARITVGSRRWIASSRVLWRPGEAFAQRSRLRAYIDWLAAYHGVEVADLRRAVAMVGR